jgi:hypothetical protein
MTTYGIKIVGLPDPGVAGLGEPDPLHRLRLLQPYQGTSRNVAEPVNLTGSGSLKYPAPVVGLTKSTHQITRTIRS